MITTYIDSTTIFLAAIWICLMLVYLLGDVLRVFSGDIHKYKEEMSQMNQATWLFASIMMLIPIAMILVTFLLPAATNRTVNIIAAIVMFLFNVIGLPTYKSHYDRFLIIVGLGLNVFTVVYAWSWVV